MGCDLRELLEVAPSPLLASSGSAAWGSPERGSPGKLSGDPAAERGQGGDGGWVKDVESKPCRLGGVPLGLHQRGNQPVPSTCDSDMRA